MRIAVMRKVDLSSEFNKFLTSRGIDCQNFSGNNGQKYPCAKGENNPLADSMSSNGNKIETSFKSKLGLLLYTDEVFASDEESSQFVRNKAKKQQLTGFPWFSFVAVANIA